MQKNFLDALIPVLVLQCTDTDPKGHGLGHMTPIIFGILLNISSKLEIRSMERSICPIAVLYVVNHWMWR